MIEPDRTEWQVRCAFNAFCKRVLKNEAINIYNERRQKQAKEKTFSDLTPQEESQLFTLDKHYSEGEEEQTFQVGGKKITMELLAEAMCTLPKEKCITVQLYYFFQLSDVEIGQLLDISRSTIQYRRTSSFERLKRFLEEHADEWDD
ncbi:RNA polymerase sigma factor [Cytobacillus purgationiresistens]|uniref:RNA polymerase sigma factor (Sigma-70 family) n=1 Tax=Cytobacillus purgationiresistens TaxID=863449 RepID=A0ABU0AQP3_9BACI|nr:RNA polymerase subunit sigma [Cytobacillus purgationiresistens]MDQ0273572.1 RNA polymerase sigma factor (sigma-70 family) [Cytobacillus purgationiresistens]